MHCVHAIGLIQLNGIVRDMMRLRDRIAFLKAVWTDERTPWHAKAVLAATLAYALSPIDLIPDFVPVLGHLDDVVIVGAGLWLARKLVPRQVWDGHRRRFGTERNEKDAS